MENKKFLYDEDLDFDFFNGQPGKIICFHFVPRSGSNLLADLIRQVGKFGFPLEYFSPANLEYMARRMPQLKKFDFSRLVGCRTSPNGVFSYKWNSNFEGLDYASEVSNRFKGMHHVFIDRLDRLAQAQSYWDALKSQAWINRRGGAVSNVPATDDDINWAARELEDVRMKTLGYLHRGEVNCLKIFAEDIFAYPQEVLMRVAGFCEVDLEGVELPMQSRWTAPS